MDTTEKNDLLLVAAVYVRQLKQAYDTGSYCHCRLPTILLLSES